ncbi:hypothetical protein [Pedobacter sp. ASV28]|uniref:hypothetical protein n=1 Tax=Pedobacter sp. ASV28 TaxID=2795123 RepID=UPI0018EBDDFB|nr:hypothetical protein [Pedobacter sp. ASV28]
MHCALAPAYKDFTPMEEPRNFPRQITTHKLVQVTLWMTGWTRKGFVFLFGIPLGRAPIYRRGI